MPSPLQSHLIPNSKAWTKSADAEGDEEYIAVALFLEAPVWILAKDLGRVPLITRFNAPEVRDL
jgi:hypothetical protein